MYENNTEEYPHTPESMQKGALETWNIMKGEF